MGRIFAAVILFNLTFAGLQAVAQTGDRYPIITFKSPDKIELVDGDTLWIGIHQVRLQGIDAVEPDQSCLKAGAAFDCHRAGMNYLATLTSRNGFRCEVKTGKDGKPAMSYGRYVATCYAGQIEINRAMVAAGWALPANTQAGDPYRKTEADAMKLRAGLHALSYEKPWAWRKKKNGDNCSCEDED